MFRTIMKVKDAHNPDKIHAWVESNGKVFYNQFIGGNKYPIYKWTLATSEQCYWHYHTKAIDKNNHDFISST